MKLIYDATLIAEGVKKNNRTGIYFTALNILNELIKRKDIELTLYCESKRYSDLLSELATIYRDKTFEIITSGHYIKLVKLHSELYTYKNDIRKSHKFFIRFLTQIKLNTISFLIKLDSKINSIFKNNIYSNYEVFLSPIYKIPVKFRKYNKIKKIVILYDTVPIKYPDLNPASQKNSWYYQLLKTLNKDDYYCAISKSTRLDFLKHYPQIDPAKIKTTLLACDDNFRACNIEQISKVKSKYNIPLDKKYVFSLCTLEPRKNLVRTVKTFIEFIKKNYIDDMVFVLGGGHWEMFINELNKAITDLGDYQDKILKIGYVDDEDLAPLYSGAEWFTYTSQYEGFGLPPLEAMSCGCPVITSNNSSLPEVVGDAGIMIDWDSDEQHIEAYEKYYFNEDLRKEYAQKGLERAKQFSWEKCVDAIVGGVQK